MSKLKELLMQVADLYEQTGITLNTFPFKLGDEVRWRIYTTDTRKWKFDNPLVNGTDLHYTTLEDALEATLTRVRDVKDLAPAGVAEDAERTASPEQPGAVTSATP